MTEFWGNKQNQNNWIRNILIFLKSVKNIALVPEYVEKEKR